MPRKAARIYSDRLPSQEHDVWEATLTGNLPDNGPEPAFLLKDRAALSGAERLRVGGPCNTIPSGDLRLVCRDVLTACEFKANVRQEALVATRWVQAKVTE